MAPIVHGIDVVDVLKFRHLLAESADDFISECFTSVEREYADSDENFAMHFAGCFAVKEAVSKALGTGFDGEVSPLEIEVIHSAAGCPNLRLSGTTKELAAVKGVTRWLVSISHTQSNAFASVLGCG